ncbi:uncharacterized protein TEOVI_000083600 [Trypanosoma equiperdum]|uniref:Uncharacterized protein n=4 Tax=Trypanozoon TaxID=39700 RepID=Q38A21_TRYB2|nr:conserved hypothetical protein, unlikely [Trypanosoma brucei gambiense DAL972]XP_823177.1 hypothetical protein, unlikely [Trypanosoma brucei brucei TREU927]RHW69096.1 hypothetical protein DPX39_100102600 [Trypanosoma brucei equiperdum]SCU69270.1 hypothetical protein, conserved [Trypanosoma equiperdum]EAN78349.1 hypothetical protein, unlikely [Trypanosoma brucei brucei TREU927]CBH16071.1 conserved hypothetical protein, unlikely [Trypanosoma brucei gambiense DAL972]|eukprot:XP_011778335.1 conserved hypothetical protein, unlikely [Trypanosoma brucei gambiense DAL972]
MGNETFSPLALQKYGEREEKADSANSRCPLMAHALRVHFPFNTPMSVRALTLLGAPQTSASTRHTEKVLHIGLQLGRFWALNRGRRLCAFPLILFELPNDPFIIARRHSAAEGPSFVSRELWSL